jgi:hypothetical protein
MQERNRGPGKPKPRRAQPRGPADGNQGEGNREADRRYREKASEFARSPRARDAAEEARRELDERREAEIEDIRPDWSDSPDRDDYGDVEREQPSRGQHERR